MSPKRMFILGLIVSILTLGFAVERALATPGIVQADYTWSANPAWANNPPTGIKVFRGTGPDPVTYTQVGPTLPPTATTLNDPLTGVALGTRICAKVVPTNNFGDFAGAVALCQTPDTPGGAINFTIQTRP